MLPCSPSVATGANSFPAFSVTRACAAGRGEHRSTGNSGVKMRPHRPVFAAGRPSEVREALFCRENEGVKRTVLQHPLLTLDTERYLIIVLDVETSCGRRFAQVFILALA